ncbi:MAG: hypothetical protein WBE80_06210 [Methylocella sp.]
MGVPHGAVLHAVRAIVEVRVKGHGQRDDPLLGVEADGRTVEAGRPDIGVNTAPSERAGRGGPVGAGLARYGDPEVGSVTIHFDLGANDIEWRRRLGGWRCGDPRRMRPAGGYKACKRECVCK